MKNTLASLSAACVVSLSLATNVTRKILPKPEIVERKVIGCAPENVGTIVEIRAGNL